MSGFWGTLWWLVCVHALCDYVLQPEYMAKLKRPGGGTAEERQRYGPWWWWMGAHSLINGLGVTYITQEPILGMAEALVHGSLDTLKCRGMISSNQDQLGHLLSKVLWATLMIRT